MSLFKKIAVGVSTVALPASMFFGTAAVTKAATAGGVYSTPDGTVWFVTKDMQKRAFTSAGAFLSYGFLNFSQVMPADASVTALPSGAFIAPADGKIFCATQTKDTDVAGECALITGSKKAAFTSAAVFAAQGHSFARAVSGDSSFLAKTANIDNGSAAHLPGVLVNNNGTVQMVVTGGLWGIPSQDVFNSWGYNYADVVPANSADTAKSQVGVIPARMAGELVPTGNAGGGNTTADCNSLDGNTGDVTVTKTGTYSSEEVGEAQEQGVLSFDVEADDNSDVAVSSVKVVFKQTHAGDSKKLKDYVDSVQVMMDDEEVGSASASSFNESSDVYSKSISLDCAAVSAGETREFWIQLTGADSFDSADIDSETMQVEVQSLRFEDGDGVTSTKTVGDANIATNTAGDVQEQPDFVDFATATDVELRTDLTDGEEAVNEAHNVIVDDDNTTDNIELLKFTLTNKGDSDINVDEIPVLITTSDSDLDTVISTASLYNGSTKVDTKSISTSTVSTATATFDDLNIDIAAGDSEDFTVQVKALKVTGNYSQGTTLNAQVTIASISATDEQDDDLATSDLTGSAVGENASFFSNGITVEVNSATTDVNAVDGATNDIASFTWNITLTNIGDDDLYVNADNVDVVSSSAALDVDQIYAIDQSGTNALTAISGTVDEDGGSGTKVTADASAYSAAYSGETFFKLTPGQSRTFSIVVTGTNGTAAGQVRAYLSSIEWTTDDITSATAHDGDTATINSYSAQLTQDSKTPFKAIN